MTQTLAGTHPRFPRQTGPLLLLTAIALLAAPPPMRGEKRISLVPRLHAGQLLHYSCVARIKQRTKTESRVINPAGPSDLENQISTDIRIIIKQVRIENGKPIVVAHADLESPPDDLIPAATKNATPLHGKLDFTIGANGQVTQLSGLDDLPPQQRLAWQYWLSQFAYGWTLPSNGAAPGEEWKSEQPESTPTPIADLFWERETTYVRNDNCPILPNETCAVFLTRARLKQKSSDDNATPETYRLHNLKTSGSAKGTNETISYMSLRTHLMLRAKEDLQQSMDATIAKSDDSNEVRYLIEANSQFETFLVTP